MRKYLMIQLKRFVKQLPFIVVFAFITTVSVAAVMFFSFSKKQNKFRIGIVGELNSSYINLGVSALNNFDASRSFVKFEEFSEEEAQKSLTSGDIIGYFDITDEFISGLENGENRQIKFITSSNQVALTSALAREAAKTISSLLIVSERAVYALDEYLVDNQVIYDRGAANRELNKKLIVSILDRDVIYDVSVINGMGKKGLIDYYVVAIWMFLLLMSGMIGSTFFGDRNIDLSKILISRGIDIYSQSISELIIIMLVNTVISLIYFLTAILFKIEFSIISFGVPLTIILISSMQFFFYEIVKEGLSSMLFEFIAALSLAYISGCIYPIEFFPEKLQQFANVLPVRVCMRLVYDGEGSRLLIVYSLVFFVSTILIRRKRICG